MYSNPYVQLCEPCPIECQTCTNHTQCLSCINGYMLSNNYQCIVNTTNENSWVSKKAVNNYTNFMGMGPLVIETANQSLINITDQNFMNYETNCAGLAGTTWFGGYQTFDYTTKIIKTIYNLPPHQWINIRFHAVLIDQWIDNTLVVELNSYKNYFSDGVSLPNLAWSGTFNTDQRFSDFCGNTHIFDNVAVVDAWIAHNSSLAKIRIRMN